MKKERVIIENLLTLQPELYPGADKRQCFGMKRG